MLGFVGLIALAMFSWQAWRIANGRGGSSHPHYQKQVSPDSFQVTEESPSVLKDDEFRIVPRKSPARNEEAPNTAKQNDVEIDPAWLMEVHDNTVGIRQDEADAYYRVLAKAEATPLDDLQAHAQSDALFVNLMTSPERYRGRVVTVIGELRRLFEIPAPENDYGLTKLYEAWICTEESGENPYRIVCTSIPDDFKPQETSRVAVKVTGYFFKREGYQTWDGRLHVAPTVLAGRISKYVSPQAPPPVEDVVPWMVAVISVVGLAMLATVIGYAMSDSRGKRGQRITQTISAVDVAQLSRADRRMSIEESLRRLEEGELIEESGGPSLNGNGHAEMAVDLPEEVIDLPTPFPPTRVPRHPQNRLDG